MGELVKFQSNVEVRGWCSSGCMEQQVGMFFSPGTLHASAPYKGAEAELGVELDSVVVERSGLHDGTVEQPVGLGCYKMGFNQRGPCTLPEDCDFRRARERERERRVWRERVSMGGGSGEQTEREIRMSVSRK